MMWYRSYLVKKRKALRYTLNKPLNLLLLLAGILSTVSVFAQLKIDYPSERAVYQRDASGYGSITVAGTYTKPVDQIEVKAVPVYPGQGIEVAWTKLDTSPSGGVFSGQFRVFGGWYTILVRGLLDGVEVEQSAVNRMGIGEVFIIAGQSNAQGLRSYPHGPGARDERVSYITNNQNTNSSLADPDPPLFAHLKNSDAFISPMGQGAWCWGVLGDLLVQKLNVPVLFINTSWEGTSIKNWSESAKNQTTYNSYGGFLYPPGMPFGNLLISIRHYASTLGLRSILWMQGETDTYPARTSRTEYSQHLQSILSTLGALIEKRVEWTIARTSRTSTNYTPEGSITSQAVINAQNDVLDTPFNNVLPGPYTDNLGLPRPDGVHFLSVEGLITLGNAWNEMMDQNYFQKIDPLQPTPVPSITAQCAENNSSVVLTLPAGYSSYRWSNGATSRTITVTSPGTYSATVKNAKGMAVISSPVRIETVKPTRPAIIPARDSWVCSDSDFEFSVNGTHEFTWMKDGNEIGSGSKFKAGENGTYTVRATNTVGCVSDVSVARKLTILPEVTTPVVGQAGPFSLMASVKGDTIPMTYKWFKDEVELPDIKEGIFKVTDLAGEEGGMFKAIAYAHFRNGNSGTTTTCQSEISESFFYTIGSDEEVVVFPVPADKGEIFIESRETSENVTITIFDLQGKNVANEYFSRLSEREKIRLSLSRGVYIMKIETSGKIYHKRLVIL